MLKIGDVLNMKEIVEKMLKTNNISDFLAIWLENDLLSAKNNAVFNEYYFSYKKNFGKYIRHYYRRQTKELMDIIKDNPSLKILEVGCGSGTESLWMALNGASVTAIDIIDTLLNVAKERQHIMEAATDRKLLVKFKKQSILDVESTDQYDVVWIEQAFHHLEPREMVLEKIKELVRPGGTLIISESNAWNPIISISLLKQCGFKRVITRMDEDKVIILGDERIITPLSLKRKLKKVGFKNIRREYYRVFPNRKWTNNIKPVRAFLPIPFIYTHYNLIAKRKGETDG